MFAKRVIEHEGEGRLYILRLTTKDNVVVNKIGMTNSPRSTDRMMEILRSWFVAYRYVPLCELRLDYSTGVPLLLEQHMHDVLKEFKWVPDKKVDGGQEMFTGLEESEVIDYVKNFDYSVLLKGKTTMEESDSSYILSKITVKEDITKDIEF